MSVFNQPPKVSSDCVMNLRPLRPTGVRKFLVAQETFFAGCLKDRLVRFIEVETTSSSPLQFPQGVKIYLRGGICGGESQQWLSYPTNLHARFDERGVETELRLSH